MCVCVYVCVHVCAHMRVCVCVSLREGERGKWWFRYTLFIWQQRHMLEIQSSNIYFASELCNSILQCARAFWLRKRTNQYTIHFSRFWQNTSSIKAKQNKHFPFSSPSVAATMVKEGRRYAVTRVASTMYHIHFTQYFAQATKEIQLWRTQINFGKISKMGGKNTVIMECFLSMVL